MRNSKLCNWDFCNCPFSDFILSLRLTEVRIPNHTVRNSTARLECHYDMDGEELYSVKWYMLQCIQMGVQYV